jgi:hypothetical protein
VFSDSHPLRTVWRVLAILIGSVGGVVVFLQYYFPNSTTLNSLAQPFLQWVVLLTAASLVLAIGNLLTRHIRQLPGQYLSGFLIVGFLVMFVAGLLPKGYTDGLGQWLYHWLLAPGMAALFALLPIFLVYALIQRLHIRDIGALLFAIALLLVVLGQTPLLVDKLPVLAAIRHDILIAPVAAVFRGILIGLALGVILTILTRIRSRL